MLAKKNKYAGMDFRDNYITNAVIEFKDDKPVLSDLITLETTENILENGRVKDKKQTSSMLKDSIQSKHKKVKNLHLAFPTQNILVRRITTLPDLHVTELAKLLSYQVGESIHLPFDQATYDFIKIGTIEENGPQKESIQEELTLSDLGNKEQEKGENASNNEDKKSDILFFATSKPLSQDFLDMTTMAGYKPLTAETRGLALQRLISYTNKDWLMDTKMIVDLSSEAIDIHIFTNGTIAFSQTMSIEAKESFGGQTALEPDVLPFNEGLEEENIEIAATIEEEVEESTTKYVDSVVREVEKAQNFYQYSLSRNSDALKRVIITGKNTKKSIKLLKNRIDTDVVEIDFSPVLTDDFIKTSLLNTSSVAIGLALKGNDTAKKKWKSKIYR